MKRFLLFSFVCCALLYTSPDIALTASNGDAEPLSSVSRDPDLDAAIEAIIDEHHLVGVAVATFCTDRIYHLGHYGFAQLEDSIPVAETTIFCVGSVSKVVSATVGMQAWEGLDVSLDAELADFVDFDIEHPTCPDSAITLRHTFTHTAAFPEVWAGSLDTPICEDVAGALDPDSPDYNPGFWAEYCPGRGHNYGPMGPCLAACFAAQNGGPTFPEYCQTNLFDPLGMTNSHWFGDECYPDQLAYVYTYDAVGDSFRTTSHCSGNSAGYPANGLRTTAADLTRYVMAVMQGGRLGNVRILEETTVAEMLTVQFPEVAPDQGLMWYRSYSSTLQDWYWCHAGGVNGPRAYVVINETAEGSDYGLVLITNSGDMEAFTALVVAAFQSTLANLDACENGEGISVDVAEVPASCRLRPIHPNPFNPQSSVSFELTKAERAKIEVFDLTGRCVNVLADRVFRAGTHSLVWNGRDGKSRKLPSGSYLVRLETGSGAMSRKVMLVR